ncbi:MAG: ubiquinol-cytochrome C chaperone family protein [Siculibacillus sp.]
MIFGLFGRRFDDETIDLYGSIVAEARRPVFYLAFGVPDTVTARFDMIVLMTALVLNRLETEPHETEKPRRGAPPTVRERGRRLIDLFFTEMDRALREMGVGDVGVPKRIKKLASAWNGRFLAYDAALRAENADELTAAISRNVLAEVEDRSGAAPLARFALAARAALAAAPITEVLAGRIPWPDPETVLPRPAP